MANMAAKNEQSPIAGAPESRRAAWLVAICCAIYFTSYLTRKGYDASILAICESTGLARKAAGLASTAAAAAQRLRPMAAGCRRGGRRAAGCGRCWPRPASSP